LEDMIANLEQQMKSSITTENVPSETSSEPVQEVSEDLGEGVGAGVLPQPEQNEVEVSQEGSKRKKRNLF